MNVRILGPADIDAFNKFLGGDRGGFDPNQDVLFGVFETVNNVPNTLVALLAARKVFYMHELRLADESSPIARRIMENLYFYSLGAGRIMMGADGVTDALIRVPTDRTRMLQFHLDHGGVREDPGTLIIRSLT